MDNQRFFLWVALGAILIMLWTSWQAEYGTPTETVKAPLAPQDKSLPTAPQAPSAVERPSATAVTPTTTAATLVSAKKVHVVTDLLDVEIDTHGGDIRSVRLRKYPVALDQKDTAFEFLSADPKTLFIAQSGIIGRDRDFPYHRTNFSTKATEYQLKEGDKELEVVLTWRGKDNVDYQKVFRFSRNSYVIDVNFRVNNRSSKPWQGFWYSQLQRNAPEHKRGLFSLPTFSGGAIYTAEDQYQKISYEDMASKDLDRKTSGGWAAIMQHYFVAAWMAKPDQAGALYTQSLGQNIYAIGYKQTTPTTVAPGQTGSLGMRLYVGPKEHKRLRALEETAKGMELTVDFGWLTFISAPLFLLLAYINTVVTNWGWSIIILTFLLKLAFYPLNNASYKSMANMRRLQPKLQSLKERYANDKTRYNQAMMEMYKKEKLNPMAGCLPMLVQIPVFIALYWVLLETVEMRQAPFALWIKDLSAPDPYFVLPILMGLSMFATTWLTPATDPMQRKIFMAMPVVMTVFFLFFPSGLVLYWFINNVLQFVQQWYITKKLGGLH